MSLTVDRNINEVRVYKCASWEEFLREIRKPRLIVRDKSGNHESGGFTFANNVLYRGHSNPTWKLSSTLERDLRLAPNPDGVVYNLREMNGVDWYNDQCAQILDRFTANAAGLPNFERYSLDLDRWLLGRHYGLQTPYLDWTLSPFVAAFFALQEIIQKYSGLKTSYAATYSGHVVVWGLRQFEELRIDGEFDILEPRTFHETRARAQNGALTKLTSKEHLDVEAYLHSREKAYCLEKFEIDLNDATIALRDLELMNITYMTLFPDLDGAAASANVFLHWAKLNNDFSAAQQAGIIGGKTS